MKLHASGEDYLETILVLKETRYGALRRCGPAHGGVKAQRVPSQWLPCGTAAFSQWTKITFSI